jgi:hypothetical protein
MLGARFFAASVFAASVAGFAGSSSGKDRSRLSPEASCLSEGEEEDAGGGVLGDGFCCAHTALLNANSKHK